MRVNEYQAILKHHSTFAVLAAETLVSPLKCNNLTHATVSNVLPSV
jgi:hypothetical protein